MKYNWNIVHEMDLEDGTPAGYAATTDEWILWLTQIHDGTWDVECMRKATRVRPASPISTLVNCKTLTSAKRWVARYF